MDASLAAGLAGLLGVAVGLTAVLAVRASEWSQRSIPPQPDPVVPPGVVDVLTVLRSSAVVAGPSGEVLKATAPAHALGLVRGGRTVHPELLELVAQVHGDGQIRERELELGSGTGVRLVATRVAPLGARLVLVLGEDRTREHRVEAIRRDFVANVSHELKTPVGALRLLAAAVAGAADDPQAVQRFAGRMGTESERLGRLVQQIIELSRLQGDDPLTEPRMVPVDEVVDRAIDRSRVDADAKRIDLQRLGQQGLFVLGSGEQVSVALGNLVENAVAYSPEGSSVVVSVRSVDAMVELTVTDQGIGIPPAEVSRIFERFYRVDPARARSTGGTGLGLSIVKHVAASHGGEVKVWSAERQGSSFTLVLPASPAATTTPVGALERARS